MPAKTHNNSSSDDCGCKQPSGVMRHYVDNAKSLEPLMVQYVGETNPNQQYRGQATNTIYYGVVNGTVRQIYTADYMADTTNFEVIN